MLRNDQVGGKTKWAVAMLLKAIQIMEDSFALTATSFESITQCAAGDCLTALLAPNQKILVLTEFLEREKQRS